MLATIDKTLRAVALRFPVRSAGILGLCLLPALLCAAPTSDSDDYAAGRALGTQLRQLQQQGQQINVEDVLRGLLDGLHDDTAAGTGGNPPPTAVAPQPPARERGFKDDYARLNAQRPGVKVLASGVQYEILEAGNGPRPGAGDTVIVNYQGSLSNGVVFDDASDSSQPAHLKLDSIAVPGLKEALLLMPTGAKWRVVVPPSMGFKNSGNNQLRRRDLIYEIHLREVEAVSGKSGG